MADEWCEASCFSICTGLNDGVERFKDRIKGKNRCCWVSPLWLVQFCCTLADLVSLASSLLYWSRMIDSSQESQV